LTIASGMTLLEPHERHAGSDMSSSVRFCA
jgi:hypothetical protein